MINLQKGGNVNLSKETNGSTQFHVGLGWDANTNSGNDFDLDASAICLATSVKCLNEKYFVYYNNKETPCKGLLHTGDNRTGAGDGDDEALVADLTKLSTDVDRIMFVVTIHEAATRGQNFGQVRNAFIRVVDLSNSNTEVARFDLSEDYSVETAMTFGELYRHAGEWKFKAVGSGKTGGLQGYVDEFMS